MRRSLFFALAAAAVLMAGCGSDSTGPGGDNGGTGGTGGTGGGGGTNPPAGASFTAQLSGGVTASFTGTAAYGADTEAGDDAFGIGMSAGDTASVIGSIVLWRLNSAKPGTGTYAVADISTGNDPDANQFGAAVLLANHGQPEEVCQSTGGSVQITGSGDHLKGNFTLQLTCLDTSNPSTPVTASATGQFDAVGGVVSGQP
ncbi:MAG TPA: hypothetical protein VFL95_11815 [Gemmatimonadales bacterium]|nr:hypothetical protein [Gemmatimonadales bacterium]